MKWKRCNYHLEWVAVPVKTLPMLLWGILYVRTWPRWCRHSGGYHCCLGAILMWPWRWGTDQTELGGGTQAQRALGYSFQEQLCRKRGLQTVYTLEEHGEAYHVIPARQVLVPRGTLGNFSDGRHVVTSETAFRSHLNRLAEAWGARQIHVLQDGKVLVVGGWLQGSGGEMAIHTVRARVSNSKVNKQSWRTLVTFYGLKKPIWEEQFKRKNKEVSRIKELNDMEDTGTLLEEEMRGWQGKKEVAVKEDTKLEMGRPHVWMIG